MIAPVFIGKHDPGDDVLVAAITVDLVGAPLVHLAEGEPDNAWKNFALRLAPLAVAYAMPNENRDSVEQPSLAAVGVGVFGALAVMAVDAIFLAKH